MFVNGHYAPELSSLQPLPEGVIVGSLAQAISANRRSVEPHLAGYASFQNHAFVALNTAFMQDGAFIHARKMLLKSETNHDELVDIGLVGEIDRIDPELINLLDSRDFIPVIAPIGVGKEGEAYNINADLVAGKLAETLNAEKLVLMTNTSGVLDRNGRLLTGLTATEIEGLFADGTIHGGMLPKIGSALDAVRNGVKSSHVIDGRVDHALLLEVLTNEGVGTMIRADDAPPRIGA